jgi:ABC-type multidrug transport system ATPase subunit
MFTTHLMEEAHRYCDRLAIMDAGRLVEIGEPEQLLERNDCDSLEEVFATVTGHDIDETGGRLSDVRAQRRVANRLG